MSILQPLGEGQGYLKCGLFGFSKSGKTRTAVEFAIGVREAFGLSAPIAFFDTEGGSEYVAPLVRKRTGLDLVGVKSRAYDDLRKVARACADGEASVLIVDSITHVWRELMDAYMVSLNEVRQAKRLGPKARMGLHDIMKIKELWAPWADFFLNSALHIIICGRAGFEWGHEEDEETGDKSLVKTGVKMKVEAEFGFEPGLLIYMERAQTREGKKAIRHLATVIGDRFDAIDGEQEYDPGFSFIAPHVEMLKPGSHSAVKVEVSSKVELDEMGQTEYQARKKKMEVILEKIQAEMTKVWPGRTKEETKAKIECLESVFKTTSWKEVEGMRLEDLEGGLESLRKYLEDKAS